MVVVINDVTRTRIMLEAQMPAKRSPKALSFFIGGGPSTPGLWCESRWCTAGRMTTCQIFSDGTISSSAAKAFRGEFVPPHPNDKPAEETLERRKGTAVKHKAHIDQGED